MSTNISGYRDTTPQEDRDTWLFDYIVSFLRSPPWTVPLNTFIDENSIIFDNEEENKFVHTVCHDNFKQLIEGLLVKNLKEIGVSEEEFVEACARGQAAQHEANKLIFGQIMAVEDFLTFKKMMYKRNMELELEALKLMEDFHPANQEEAAIQLEIAIALSQAGDAAVRIKKGASDHDIQEAMKASILEQERLQAEYEREQAELEHAIALSLALEAERLRQAEEIIEQQKEEEKAAIMESAAHSKKSAPTPEPVAAASSFSAKSTPPRPAAEAASAQPQPQTVKHLQSQSAGSGSAKKAQDEEVHASPAAPAAASAKSVDAPKEAAAKPAPSTAHTQQTHTAAAATAASGSSKSSAPVSSLPPLINKAALQSSMDLSAYTAMKEEHDRNLAKAEQVFRQNENAKKQREQAEQQTLKKAGQLTEEELKRRADFMRAQRELLLKKKNAEREAELKAFEGEKSEHMENNKGESKESQQEARRRAMQAALASRLKSDMEAIEAKRGAMAKYATVQEQLEASEKLTKDKMARQAADQAELARQEKERQSKLKQILHK